MDETKICPTGRSSSVKVMSVIEVVAFDKSNQEGRSLRIIHEYWTMDGRLLAVREDDLIAQTTDGRLADGCRLSEKLNVIGTKAGKLGPVASQKIAGHAVTTDMLPNTPRIITADGTTEYYGSGGTPISREEANRRSCLGSQLQNSDRQASDAASAETAHLSQTANQNE